MIIGLGSDIVEVARIRSSLERHQERFLQRVFSEEEQTYCNKHHDPAERFAGRWAAKEALLKAMGTGLVANMRLNEISITNNQQGAPQIGLSGAVKAHCQGFGPHRIWCTISHAAGVATATVILEKVEG